MSTIVILSFLLQSLQFIYINADYGYGRDCYETCQGRLPSWKVSQCSVFEQHNPKKTCFYSTETYCCANTESGCCSPYDPIIIGLLSILLFLMIFTGKCVVLLPLLLPLLLRTLTLILIPFNLLLHLYYRICYIYNMFISQIWN